MKRFQPGQISKGRDYSAISISFSRRIINLSDRCNAARTAPAEVGAGANRIKRLAVRWVPQARRPSGESAAVQSAVAGPAHSAIYSAPHPTIMPGPYRVDDPRRSHRLEAQDIALSRLVHRFESGRERQ